MAKDGIQHGTTLKKDTIPLDRMVATDILAWLAKIADFLITQNVDINNFTVAGYPEYPTFVPQNKQRFLLINQNLTDENGLYEYNSITGALDRVLQVSDLLEGNG